MDIYRPQAQVLGTRVDMRAVMQEVYLWMTLGLITTAAVALVFAITGLTAALGPLLFVAIIGQLGLVFYLSARIYKMEPAAAQRTFLIYAALMGVTMSTIFYWADIGNITLALFSTTAMFGAMTVVGYTTEMDLTKMGSFLMMALIGVIVAMVINIFAASAMLDFIISIAGVVIFTGLTAYDTQKIAKSAEKLQIQGVNSGAAAVRQVALMGALILYLDFINLFLFILRLMSRRR
jgi:uncharacterized protein